MRNRSFLATALFPGLLLWCTGCKSNSPTPASSDANAPAQAAPNSPNAAQPPGSSASADHAGRPFAFTF